MPQGPGKHMVMALDLAPAPVLEVGSESLSIIPHRLHHLLHKPIALVGPAWDKPGLRFQPKLGAARGHCIHNLLDARLRVPLEDNCSCGCNLQRAPHQLFHHSSKGTGPFLENWHRNRPARGCFRPDQGEAKLVLVVGRINFFFAPFFITNFLLPSPGEREAVVNLEHRHAAFLPKVLSRLLLLTGRVRRCLAPSENACFTPVCKGLVRHAVELLLPSTWQPGSTR